MICEGCGEQVTGENPKAKKYCWRTVSKLCGYCQQPYEVICNGLSLKTKYCSKSCAHKDISSRMWQDSTFKAKRQESLKKATSTATFKAKVSKAAKDAWAKPGAKEMRIQKLKDVYNNPNLRDSASKRAKARWQDPDYRVRTIQSMREYYKDNDYAREAISARAKAMWGDDAWRENHLQKMNIINKDEARRHKISESHKKRLQDENKRKIHLTQFAINTKSPEAKEKIRQASINMWQDPKFKAKMKQIMNAPNMIERNRKANTPTKEQFDTYNMLIAQNLNENWDRWAKQSHKNAIHAIVRSKKGVSYKPHIYILGFKDKNYIKVGFATSDARIKKYKRCLILDKIFGDPILCANVEAEVHSRFPRKWQRDYSIGKTEFHNLVDYDKIRCFIINTLKSEVA